MVHGWLSSWPDGRPIKLAIKRALLAVLTCISGVALADPLRIVVFDIPPYGFRKTADMPEGLYVEILQAVATRAGYVPTVKLEPFARVLADLKAGAADMSISFPTEEISTVLVPIAPVLSVDAIVVPRAGLHIKTRRDLAGKGIGRIRGGCIDLSNANDSAATLVDLNGFAEGLRMLRVGRLDGLCTTREVYRYYLQQENFKAADFGEAITINHRRAWLFLRPDASVKMQQELHEALEDLRRRNVLSEIIQRYLP